MNPIKAYAAPSAGSPLGPYKVERRDPGDHDVLIDILYCGICQSDVHQVRDEWGGSTFPMVPGHEIVGRVSRVGAKVKRFKPGDAAGVGCFVDSCRKCRYCKKGLEQFCTAQCAFTYNSTEMDRKTPTFGGYSAAIVVDEKYTIKIPSHLPLERVAPLLCAGITTYSPLRHWKVRKGQKVGVAGLGGLGHMGVKLAASMGAEVTVLSTSPSKEKDALSLGAKHFVLSNNPTALSALNGTLDFIIDTVSAPHPISSFLQLLRPDGTLVLVGASPKPLEVATFALVMGRKTLAGSLIGGIAETQEMIDYCAKKKVFADVEVIPVSKINEAYARTRQSDVRFRFVIDLKTL
jgi:alcohol dehydrogenase (NADP+)